MTRPEEHHQQSTSGTADRRGAERAAFTGEVTVSFRDLELVGPGRNISATGVYFVAAAHPQVEVLIEGREKPMPAELIRFETLADGQVGVAVRFLEAL